MAENKDHVCGMQVGESDAAGQLEHEGRTYYFCSSACKSKFEANPTEYVIQ